jgi:hypothetical protein
MCDAIGACAHVTEADRVYGREGRYVERIKRTTVRGRKGSGRVGMRLVCRSYCQELCEMALPP